MSQSAAAERKESLAQLIAAAERGDDSRVRQLLADDPTLARGQLERSGWVASPLWAAAGVAHHPELTRLLIEHGADVNDVEVTYHTPETRDNRAMIALLESGRLTPDSLATMLLRKADWHDIDGIRLLLDAGADPNRLTGWGNNALHNAVLSDNSIEIIALLLDRGADPLARNEGKASHAWRGRGRTAVAMAAWCGRADVLELFESRGVPTTLEGVERLAAACARGRDAEIGQIVRDDPDSVRELRNAGGDVLAAFARVGNAAGVRRLLDLGVDIAATISTPHLYFGLAERSTALHAAAWLARTEVVQLLLDRGAPVDAVDAKGRTPLALAVKACVDSYWVERRTPDGVAALLRAGASADAASVMYPSGYEPVDALLRAHGRRDTSSA